MLRTLYRNKVKAPKDVWITTTIQHHPSADRHTAGALFQHRTDAPIERVTGAGQTIKRRDSIRQGGDSGVGD